MISSCVRSRYARRLQDHRGHVLGSPRAFFDPFELLSGAYLGVEVEVRLADRVSGRVRAFAL